MTTPRKTLEEKRQQLSLLTQSMNEALNHFVESPDKIINFMKFRNQFPKYSFHNQLLLFQQSSASRYVGSFSYWKEQGVTIKKGEHGLKIFRPNIVKVFRTHDKEEWRTIKQATPEEQVKIKQHQYPTKDAVKGYSVGYVFDITQTTMRLEQYPDYIQQHWQSQVTQDFTHHIEGAKQYAIEKGIEIQETILKPEHSGSYNPSEHRVKMHAYLENERYFSVLTHELAHSQLHRETGKDLSIEIRELQAESVATLVLQYYGVEDVHENLNYIKAYIGDMSEQERLKAMEKTLDMVNEFTSAVDAHLDKQAALQLQIIRETYGLEDKLNYTDQMIQELANEPDLERQMKMAENYKKFTEHGFDIDERDLPNNDRYTLHREDEWGMSV